MSVVDRFTSDNINMSVIGRCLLLTGYIVDGEPCRHVDL